MLELGDMELMIGRDVRSGSSGMDLVWMSSSRSRRVHSLRLRLRWSWSRSVPEILRHGCRYGGT